MKPRTAAHKSQYFRRAMLLVTLLAAASVGCSRLGKTGWNSNGDGYIGFTRYYLHNVDGYHCQLGAQGPLIASYQDALRVQFTKGGQAFAAQALGDKCSTTETAIPVDKVVLSSTSTGDTAIYAGVDFRAATSKDLFVDAQGHPVSCTAPTCLYVAPTGSDLSACTLDSPCREIRKAAAGATAGTTILIADGTYRSLFLDSLHGSSGAPITLLAPARQALVVPTNDYGANYGMDAIRVSDSSYVTLDGLRADNAPRAGARVSQSQFVTIRNGSFSNDATYGILIDACSDVTVEANDVQGTSNAGIDFSSGTMRATVRGNVLHANAASGIQLNSDNLVSSGHVFDGNTFFGNGANGGAALNLDGIQGSLVSNNLLYENKATGIALFSTQGPGPSGMKVFHNTVLMAATSRNAILLTSTSGANLIENNILLTPSATKAGLELGTMTDASNTTGGHNVIERILIDATSTTYTLAQWQGQGFETGSLSATPSQVFVDFAGDDLHLSVTSPAKDAAVSVPEVTSDLDGSARPQGPAPDIGCYEAN